jgi:iron complex transport system substrate-binding protein
MANKIAFTASILLIFAVSFILRERFLISTSEIAKDYDCRRIVSMAPSITESLFALGLGDRVVGVTRFCKYPPEAQNISKIGGFLDPNLEAVLSLKPDLLIILPEQETILPCLKKLGLRTLVVCHKNISGVVESLRTIAEECGVAERGHSLADEIQSRLDRVHEKTATAKRPKVMIAVDRLQGSGLVDVYIAGKDDYFDAMISMAGGENVYQDGRIRFPVVSSESILRMNPDVIVDLSFAVDQDRTDKPVEVEAVLKDWQNVSDIEAVKQRRVFAMKKDYAIVPGPRIINFVEDLARLIHPEVDWTEK